MKLKIYTDMDLIKIGHPVHMLIPFIGTVDYENAAGHVMAGRFDEYEKVGKDFFEFTSIENCEVCLLPVIYQTGADNESFLKKIQPFLDKVNLSGKRLLVFAGYDVGDTQINSPNAIIFNSAVYKSSQPANVYAWPHFFEDYIGRYKEGKLTYLKKSQIPLVGFCGYVPPFGIKIGKEKIISLVKLIANYLGVIKRYPDKSSHSYRARAVIALKRSRQVITNFRIKRVFSFGPTGMLNTGKTTESNESFRLNFINNILESDYTLCVRGLGNNSVRFFETLCCGRIPVFINTDSALPFDHIINWKELCVWVEEKDIDKVAKIVSEYHKKITEEDFEALQQKLRNIWEEYLSPVGFFKHIGLFIH